MADIIPWSSTGPPNEPKKLPPITMSRTLRQRAELILQSRRNANILCDILEMFNNPSKNYTALLLAVEMIFTTMLRRRDMFEPVIAMKPPKQTPEVIHARWLRANYDIALTHAVGCLQRGENSSRVQALVTCCKLLAEEGMNPLDPGRGPTFFPLRRLKNIFEVLLDFNTAQTALIDRFREYTEFRDVQQYGLKLLSMLAYHKCPSAVYIQNYLHLFDALTKSGLPTAPRPEDGLRHVDDKYLCEKNGVVPFIYNPDVCRRHINRCWGFCLKWPLRADENNHRRSLIVLVDRLMPYLNRPVLATDLLCDSLDCGPSISMIALRGMLELVTKHKIDYPDIYDRLYGMFEPEMFATRSKQRLLHLADVFLSSTRLPESMVAAFAKRLSRLALVAPPDDISTLLGLISNMIHRHPGLRKMLCYDHPAIMPKDPYVMEEGNANASRARHSSLWEVSALQLHYNPEVSYSAARVLAAARGSASPPDLLPATADQQQFNMELKKRFKSIEMNFVRPSSTYKMNMSERLNRLWNLTGDY